MDATAIIEQVAALGITIRVTEDELRLNPGSKLPMFLLEEIKLHKAELLSLVNSKNSRDSRDKDICSPTIPRIPGIVDGKPPAWHVAEGARLVESEGICLFWSDVFQELVAFVRDDSFRVSVPAGVVVYTGKEIETLWGAGGPSSGQLRLIYEAKKRADARVTDFKKGAKNADTPLS